MAEEYSKSVLLPETGFQVKGDHKGREEGLLSLWEESGLWNKRRTLSEGSPEFVIHDGPPYANGHLHMGHALNKVLKDMVGRFFYLYGRRVEYKPGWDCHGLPIEWMVEQEYRKAKLRKEEIPVLEFRERCRRFAAEWVDVQCEEFKRLGVIADWSSVYKTMDFESEGQIVEQLLKINRDGHLYESYRPVLWSVTEKTSLAEAEVEYKDIDSRSMFVKFPVRGDEVGVLIWTTTPWTLVANRGLAYSGELSYGLYRRGDEQLIFADELADEVNEVSGGGWERGSDAPDLKSMKCMHPFYDGGVGDFSFDVPLLEADFVTAEKGTGIVHMAPAHGEDDFELAQRTRFCEVGETVDEGGLYTVEGWQGVHIFKALPLVREVLEKAGRLIGEENYRHSYPHSWRSGAPLIYRATKQLFFDLSLSGVLRKSIEEVKNRVSFVPPSAKQRLASTLELRPDWLLSRQRCWGVPITLFVHEGTGQILCDPEVDERVINCIKAEGGDGWFSRPVVDFFGDRLDAARFRKMEDILDVWFDSGCSHIFVLGDKQADLYVEGSDQHRGWFQASLLVEVQRNGRSPYKGIISHGFVLDEKGRKMSKSGGNVISPEEIIREYGADLVRVWVASSDYRKDLRIGQSILRSQAEILRKFRNTLRFMLGNLCRMGGKVSLPDLGKRENLKRGSLVDRWVLHRLYEVNWEVKEACEEYDIHRCYLLLHEFCDKDLSSLYFDILKDTLYCDGEYDERRLYGVSVLSQAFRFLVRWLSPVIPFTAEEAFLEFKGSELGKACEEESIHHVHGVEIPGSWFDSGLNEKFRRVLAIRKVVNGCIEGARQRGEIGSSNEAALQVFLNGEGWLDAVTGVNMEELCLVSRVEFMEGESPGDAFKIESVEGVGVLFKRFSGVKCPRCWLYHTGKGLCHRCERVLSGGSG